MEEIQPGIFSDGDRLFTENPVPGEKVYGEELVNSSDKELREWNPSRSKAAAALKKGVELEISKNDEMLYLGAASGTTVSHFSDIARDGFIVAVEYSKEVARDLVSLAEKRENIAPIIADARKPVEYADFVKKADIVYQDISQRDQAAILAKNCEKFLGDDGVALVAVKAQSISSTRDAEEVFEETRDELLDEFEILDEARLEPYEKDHLFLKLEKK
ncbi:MAG: fibrillarin-like rRNA/tRNA 2'-O-methyltransferase [Candidatus Nanohaloarchaea archaeon]